LGLISAPLIAAADFLALEAVKPPMLAGAGPRPGDGWTGSAVNCLGGGDRAGWLRCFSVVFIIALSFTAVTGLFKAG
jgi:hypothetical protein